MSDVTLSKAVRSNLLSLQNTANMMASTQNRLATGKKVNSALDNPVNFFTASSLNSRAGDINQLMDSMANGIQTIEAADNGLTAITKTLESMTSTLRQARQDKSFQTASYTIALGDTPVGDEQLTLSGGALSADFAINLTTTENVADPATTTGSVDGLTLTSTLDEAGFTGAGTFTISDGTTTGTFTITDEEVNTVGELINAINGTAGLNVTASLTTDGEIAFTAADNTVGITLGGTATGGITGASTQTVPTAVDAAAAKTIDTLVSEINNNTSVNTAIRASNDNGKLRIENLSTQDITTTTPTGVSGEAKIGGNTVRADLTKQYNELRDQLDKLADDASFNGINLLRGDNLKITFNETGTSEIDIQSKDAKSINSATLGIETNMEEADFDNDDTIDGFLADVKSAINTVRSQASAFGSSLSIVENRQNFSKNMINTLQTGASNLTLADANEEAANLLALQTRQQLSSTALSMASQADQAVLRLF